MSQEHRRLATTMATTLSVAVIALLVIANGSHARASGDLTKSWDFSDASQFNLDSGVEAYGSAVRLKAQNYTTDANTMALFHFDESNGTAVSDSSGNSNNGVASNAAFDSGNLNNGLSFNGHDSSVSVPNSSSLALIQKNSIEAWTKLNSNLSAGNSYHRQSIVDKGDYQLYYDNETGKVAYELADKNATQWSQAGGNDIAGSWDQNGKLSVNAEVKMGSNVYAGIGVTTGDAEVWMWNGTTWTKIGGGPDSVNGSWDSNTYEGVYSLATDGANLYAGLGLTGGDAEVWMWNGTTWAKIGGDGVNNGWTINYEEVWSMDYYSGKLYAGLGSSRGDAEVWQWSGSTWTKIGGDSINGGWDSNAEMVASLTNDGTNLYVGLGLTAGDSDVWMWDGTSWARIGGNGLNSSWGATIESVRSLRYFGGKLYAGIGDSRGDAEVWQWSGSTWTKIGGDGSHGGWPTDTYEQVASFAYDGSNLYVGLGISNGDGEVWMWNGTAWTKIGGDSLNNGWTTAQGDTVNTLLFDSGKLYAGLYDSAGDGLAYTWDGSSWTLMGGGYVNNSWGFYGFSAVQVMQNVGDYMYAGMGNTSGAAVVWRYDGTTWKLIGGQGVNNSWAPNTYEQVMSMASYNGHLIVGLGTGMGDGEVWEWNGTSWSQIGGDSLNGGWTTTIEEVDSMAAYGGYLYAGLGSGNGDGQVWRYDGISWTKIGGTNLNSGWGTTYYNVYSLAVYNGNLVAGLGRITGEGEVWSWNGTSWSQIGGDGISSSWGTTTYQSVESLIIYNGDLYAGTGNTTGAGALWRYNGTSWAEIGGDDINGSWTSGTYEKVKTLAVYNGDLYAGLGNSAGDGEAWKYDGSSWLKVGGNGLNSGWSSGVEEVESFSAYKGKFYAGTGLSTNADDLVWVMGNNAFLQSTKSSFDTNWHHIAATYDGSTMKIYIDGTLDASKSATVSMPQSGLPLLIGTSYGGREYGKPASYFDGKIDELRISDIARTNFTINPYSTTAQTITLKSPVWQNGVWHFDTMSDNETANGGTVTYRLSNDAGNTWQYWDGSAWGTSSNASQSNDVTTISDNIFTFPTTINGLEWQAVLAGNGNQQVTLNSVGATASSDVVAPSANATNIVASKTKAGSALPANGWTNSSSPDFNWTAGSDGQSGVKGYCLYLGTDNAADPITTKGMLGTSPTETGGSCQFEVAGTELDLSHSGYLASAFTTSNAPYYLLIKTIDNAGNLSASTASFAFKFDNTPPTNPGFISGPSGFINTKSVTLTWPTSGNGAPLDNNSGLAGLQYKIDNSPWYGANHSGTGTNSDLLPNSGNYTTVDPPDFGNLVDGVNTVYFRTWDNAGNVTPTYTSAALKINTSGAPSEPQSLSVNPTSNTTNSFAFSWDPPATYVGDVDNISYCYTINTTPSTSNCTFTSKGTTSLGAGPYATQPGTNTFYVVAKDESSNINYASFSSINFSANTPSPGVPLNTDIVDVSIKSTNKWRLALTWDEPTNAGAGISKYKVFRSTDDSNFSQVGSSSSTTYIDAGLGQIQYYYYVVACDSTNNCGAQSSVVSDFPTGKFTAPANLVADPVVSDITTRKAIVSWSTDRPSDSKIALGTESGKYNPSEIANSAQVSAHSIELDNLSAGTTYYFIAKWTDGDGNTGKTQEYTFKTAPPPSLGEVSSAQVTLSSATIQFTSTNANRVDVYYGPTAAFGGVQTINTSSSQSSYNVPLTDLTDGTKYLYKLVTYDSDGNSYDGNTASFMTPARPHISNLRFQPIDGKPTSTQQVTWDTNVASDSTISYGVVGVPGADVHSEGLVTSHSVIISDLADDSEYFLVAQSRDASGNLATSDRQLFHTALDTRPPKISNVSVQPSIRGNGAEARGQIIVSWSTDEPATSQVAYAAGTSSDTSQTTSEDGSLSFEHVVIVSNLPTSKVYSIVPISKDKSDNTSRGSTQTTVVGRASDDVMTIVLNTLRKVFGF
ncbi:MAG: LamG-like jellyroll fold domain-containing protein [Candidatus Saccharimonadales bacterium]